MTAATGSTSAGDPPGPGAFHFERLDHVQLAIPVGAEAEAEAKAFFVGVLGMTPLPRPEALAGRGGCWFRAGDVVIHLGVEEPFRPARKAHPAILVHGIDDLAARLATHRYAVRWDHAIPGLRRFHSDDPWGNRLEFVGAAPG